MTNSVSKTKHKDSKPLRRKKLVNQLLILALIPSIVAFGFMAILLFREYKAMYQTRRVSNIVEYMVKVSYLIHELQKERGASSGYIGIGGIEMAGELNSQRLLTDRKYIALKRYIDSTDMDQFGQKCCAYLKYFLKKLDDLPNVRKNITSLSITRNQSIEYISGIINHAIESFQQANVTIKDSPLSFPFTACVNFIMAKEMAGIERAIMTGLVAADKPVSEADIHKWMRVLKGQEALFAAFEHQASEEVMKEFRNMIRGDNTKIVKDIRKQIYEKHKEGYFGLMPSDVFAVATWRIDELKEIEDMQTNEILHSAKKYLSSKTTSFIVYVVLTVVSISTIFILSLVITRHITRPIITLSKATKRISEGTFDQGINIKSGNEIGELASGFDQMRKDIKALINNLNYVNKELEDFAYVVSHDLKAPLRAIHNYADFLRKDLKGNLEEEQEMYLDGLGESVHQSECFIENVLMLSRIGKHNIEVKNVDMDAYLQDMISSLNLPSDVEIILKKDWPTMGIEPTLSRQIFQNLIINGAKFNQSSQKTIEIGWQQVDKERYEILVRDNGIGIEDRFFEKIFSPFQRLHTSEEYEGTGIGLATVIRAANRLQWSVRVESTPGEGSTFFITIPKV